MLTIQDDMCIINHDAEFIIDNMVKKIAGGVWILCLLLIKPGMSIRFMV